MAAIDRGWTHLSAGRWQAAIAEFDQAIAEESTASRAHVGRAIALRQTGDFDEALRELQRAIARDPSSALAYHERGAMYASQGWFPEALRDLDRSIDLEPSAKALTDRGGVLSKLGRSADAVADLRRATTMDPQLAAAHFNLGAVLASTGQVRDSVPALRRSRELGFEQAGPALERALQELYVAASEDGSMGLAVESLLDARSQVDLQEALDRFPFMALPEFLDSVRNTVRSLPPQTHPGLLQRIEVLERLAAR